jgi:hypothetical protein
MTAARKKIYYVVVSFNLLLDTWLGDGMVTNEENSEVHLQWRHSQHCHWQKMQATAASVITLAPWHYENFCCCAIQGAKASTVIDILLVNKPSGSLKCKTLAYWDHSQVMIKKCCEYGPRSLNHKF